MAGYWSVVGYGIVAARAAKDPMEADWWLPAILSLPWSLAGGIYEPRAADERAWFTAVTAGGAYLNGMLLLLLVWRRERARRPVDPQVSDYRDAGS